MELKAESTPCFSCGGKTSLEFLSHVAGKTREWKGDRLAWEQTANRQGLRRERKTGWGCAAFGLGKHQRSKIMEYKPAPVAHFLATGDTIRDASISVRRSAERSGAGHRRPCQLQLALVRRRVAGCYDAIGFSFAWPVGGRKLTEDARGECGSALDGPLHRASGLQRKCAN